MAPVSSVIHSSVVRSQSRDARSYESGPLRRSWKSIAATSSPAVEVAVAEDARVRLDFARERRGPVIVGDPLLRVERLTEPEVEDRFTREVELPEKKRRVERSVDARIRNFRDRLPHGGRAAQPSRSLGRLRGEPGREVFGTEVLEDLISGIVFGVEHRNPDPRREVLPRGEPPPPGILLLGRVDDSENAFASGEREPHVSSPSDVARQDLDGERSVAGPPRESQESGELRRDRRIR